MLAPGFDLPLLFVQCYLHVLSSLSLCRWQLLTDNEARGNGRHISDFRREKKENKVYGESRAA